MEKQTAIPGTEESVRDAEDRAERQRKLANQFETRKGEQLSFISRGGR